MSGREVYGKYALLARVASGGMAEVFLARSSSIGGFEKILAIKRMHPRLGANQGFVSLFIEEAKLSVALNHPNIVQVFDFGRVDDNYYIAMEYVEGVDLATLAARARDRGQALPVDACVYVMSRVFEGLAYAHTRRDRQGRPSGIIHRDVSPHNVLVSYEGQVKISDFGIAKAVEELKRSERGEVVGKVAYMSPEQARGEVITTAADIWGGGVILHEVLTNMRLFARTTDQDTLYAVANLPIVRPSAFNPNVPPVLDDIVLRVLDRDVTRRPSAAREVAEELGDVLRMYYPRTNELKLADVIGQLWDGAPPMLLAALEDSRSLAPRYGSHFDQTIPETNAPAVSAAHDEEPEDSTRSARPGPMPKPSISATDLPTGRRDPWMPPSERPAPRPGAPALESWGLEPIASPSAWAVEPADREWMTGEHEPLAPDASQLADTALPAREGAPTVEMRRVPLPAGQLADPPPSAPPAARTAGSRTPSQESAAREVARLKALFAANPSLWVLVEIADAYEAAGMHARALTAYELAAGKFAQRGLLVQAVAIYRGLLDRFGSNERLSLGLRRLPLLPGMSDAELMIELFDPGDETADFSEFHGLFGERGPKRGDPVEVLAPAPILSALGSDQVERLVQRLRLLRVPPSQEIIREGDPGDSFFLIGRGRVVVSATSFDGRRVYLTSLADGDCFGEQSFFTGRARDANVESMDEALLLEVDKHALNELVDEFPAVRDTLRQFYKDRVAESLLARSSIFGRLAVRDRRLLAARFQFTTCDAGDIILSEGEASDAFYAIKSGRVEVFSGHAPNEVQLAVLKTGEVFGEIAALKGIARTASVRALEPCELMRLEAADLRVFVDQNQDIRTMIEAQIEARADETARKMSGS